MPEPSIQPRLVEQVYEHLLEVICSGALAPGTRLAQEWLAERLDVSRQPVGQALALLKSQGFVCDVGRRGLMVAPLKAEFVESIYAVRGAMDRLAAGGAARRRAPQAKSEGQRLLANGRRALASDSLGALIAAEVEFHGFIYALSGNLIIAETMALNWNRLRRVMSVYLKHSDWAKDTWKEHEGILGLIISGDARGAERAAFAHVQNATRMLVEEISAPQPGLGLGLNAIPDLANFTR